MRVPSPLTPEMWDRVADAFDGAIALPLAQQQAHLAESLGDDPRLLTEAKEMLRAHQSDVPLAVEARLVADAPPEGSLPAGHRVGAYTITEMLGEGGMGEVYRAERSDGDFKQSVALKIVRAGLRSTEFVRRFQLERQILQRLTHPAIVTILDGGATEDGRPFLVMPYVSGEPVTAYCDRSGLDLPARVRLIKQMAETVQYAHSRLVVHRDLKPSNILVSDDGSVRLLDFGIAKLLDSESDSGPFTRSLIRLLTPAYAAPEQVRGDQVTTATDVYALGVLAFELLAGRPLVQRDGRPLSEVERSVLEDLPPVPSTVCTQAWRSKLRGDLDRIVLMALRKEPERRYASAGAFAEDLERYLAGLPVRAERDTAWYRLRKFTARNKTLVSLGSAIAVLLVVLAVSSTMQMQRVARERDRAEREKAVADSVAGLLARLFDKANPSVDPGGDTIRVRDVLAEGARRVDSLTTAPGVQARLWRTLATMQLSRGRHAEAVELYQRAYDQMMRIPNSDSGDVARTAHELARAIRLFRGNDIALPMLRASLARLTTALGDTATDVRHASLDVALATNDDGERHRILDALLRFEEAQPIPDSMARAAALNAQGAERLGRGEYASALTSFQASLHIVEHKLPSNHPIRMTLLGNNVSATILLGDFAKSDSLTRELLKLNRAAVAPDSDALARTLERWGIVRAHLRDYAEGERALRETLAIERQILAPTHERHVGALRNLAHIVAASGRVAAGLQLLDSARILARGLKDNGVFGAQMLAERVIFLLQLQRLGEARRDLNAASDIIRARAAPDNPLRTDLEGERAQVLLAERRPDSAQVVLEQVLGVYVRRFPANHPYMTGTRCGIGIALAEKGEDASALQWLRPACDEYAATGVRSAWLVDEATRTLARLEKR